MVRVDVSAELTEGKGRRRENAVRLSGAEPPNGREGRGAGTGTQLGREPASGARPSCRELETEQGGPRGSAWCRRNGFGSRPCSLGSKWGVASVLMRAVTAVRGCGRRRGITCVLILIKGVGSLLQRTTDPP